MGEPKKERKKSNDVAVGAFVVGVSRVTRSRVVVVVVVSQVCDVRLDSKRRPHSRPSLDDEQQQRHRMYSGFFLLR